MIMLVLLRDFIWDKEMYVVNFIQDNNATVVMCSRIKDFLSLFPNIIVLFIQNSV